MIIPEDISLHPFNHLCGILVFIAMAFISYLTRSSGILVLAIWNLSGVILHEAAHLLAGLLFRARPAGFSLIPRRTGTGWQLGSVSFTRINGLNAVPIALAPMGLAVLAYIAWINWFFWLPASLPSTAGLYLAMFLLLYNALPSRQDLCIACNLKSILVYAPILATVAYFKFF